VITVTLFANGNNRARPIEVGRFDSIDLARGFVFSQFAESGIQPEAVRIAESFGSFVFECDRFGYQLDEVRHETA